MTDKRKAKDTPLDNWLAAAGGGLAAAGALFGALAGAWFGAVFGLSIVIALLAVRPDRKLFAVSAGGVALWLIAMVFAGVWLASEPGFFRLIVLMLVLVSPLVGLALRRRVSGRQGAAQQMR